ncbi:MAG: hypothetical protein ACRBN8_09990 [Nannocystales bacterium]
MRNPPTFLRFLTSEGLLSYEDAKKLTEESSKTSTLLGQLMVQQKHVTLAQMVKLLEAQVASPSQRLGELAIAAGYLDEAALQDLLAQQSRTKAQHPVEILRRNHALPEETLFEAMTAYIRLVEQD